MTGVPDPPPSPESAGSNDGGGGTGLPAALLEAAEAEILERGFGALSLRSIARRVGVSHQAPGHHFRDRRGLLAALAAKGYETLAEELRAAEDLGPDAGPIDELLATGVAYVLFAQRHPALFEVMFRPELQRADDVELASARQDAFGVLIEAVAAARASGWGEHHDQHTLALLCWTAVHGTATLWRDGVLATFFDEDDPHQVAMHVTSTIGVALAAPGAAPAGTG